MKKTEKIEIRLSHEDKERLNKIAEREGRTISQIVRGLIDRYIDLNSASGVKRFSIKDKLIWGVLGAIGGALLVTPIILKNAGDLDTIAAEKRLEVFLSNTEESISGSISFPLSDGFKDSVTLSLSAAEHHKIDFEVKSLGDGFYDLVIQSCLKNDRECVFSGQKNMTVGPKGNINSKFYDENGNQYSIYIFTPKG